MTRKAPVEILRSVVNLSLEGQRVALNGRNKGSRISQSQRLQLGKKIRALLTKDPSLSVEKLVRITGAPFDMTNFVKRRVQRGMRQRHGNMKLLTRVVNIKLDERYDLYIGRHGKGHDGWLGNPYPVSLKQPRGASLREFEAYFLRRLKLDEKFKARVDGLLEAEDRVESAQLVYRVVNPPTLTLGCFCAPKGGITAADRPHICHGQIIAAYLDQLRTEGK